MSSIRNPKGIHHTEHEFGGVDALVALDGSVITTGAVAAARGGTGVTTGLTVLNGSNITTGTVPDAAHSANVAMRNAGNTFAATQAISATTPSLFLVDTSAAANNQKVFLQAASGVLNLYTSTDAGGAQTLLSLDRAGGIKGSGDFYEKNRTTPMGHWQNLTPVLTAAVGTATLVGNNVCAYMAIGKTLFLNFYLNVTLSNATGYWALALPAGNSIFSYSAVPCAATGGLAGVALGSPGQVTMAVQRDAAGSLQWAAGTAWYSAVAILVLA